MSRLLLILDDDRTRLRGFDEIAPRLGKEYVLRAWRDAPSMIAEIDHLLGEAQLISLDHDLYKDSPSDADPGSGRVIANLLSKREPVCPVIVHSTNTDAAWGMFNVLASTGWKVELVHHLNQATWIEDLWLPVAIRLLGAVAGREGIPLPASPQPAIVDVIDRANARGVTLKTLLVLEQFERDVARDPNDAYAYATMGTWWHYEQQYAKALDHLNMAIRFDPRFAYALCARADLQATCPDPVYRNGESAVKDATEALDIARQNGQLKLEWKHRMYLRVLAAAHAEAGNFKAAIEIEKDALAFTITRSATRKIKAHLARYESREPIRDAHGVIGHGPGRRSNA